MQNEFQREKFLTPLKWLAWGIWCLIALLVILVPVIDIFSWDIFPTTRWYILFLMPIVFVFNSLSTYLIFYRKKQLSEKGLRILLTFNIVVIQFFITIAVNITGGVETVAYNLYHFVTLFTITAFSSTAVILFSLLSGTLYATTITLEHFGILAHHFRFNSTVGVFGDGELTFFIAGPNTLWILAVAIFGSFIGHIIRKREEQIFSERHRISVIIQHLPDGILLLDPDHRLIYMNPSAENIIGVPAENVLNRVFHIDKRESGLEILHDLIFTLPKQKQDKDIPFVSLPSFDYEIGEKHRERYFRVTPLTVQERDGTSLGRMIIIHDTTRSKLIDKLKSEFLSVAAHQLRTPLTAVKWALQMVRDGDTGTLTQEQYEMLEKGFISNQRMINLVNDLLDASRIEEGRFRYEFKKLQLEELIQSLLSELDPVIKERNIQLVVDIPSTKLPFVYGDESKLRMVFQNLIDNAARYTRSGGKMNISVNFDAPQGLLVFRIQDTGVGIPKEAQNQIFTKFFRSENVVRLQTEGTGLGLFIAKNIIVKHRGTISFESEEGKGTEFIVTLPSSAHFDDYQENEDS